MCLCARAHISIPTHTHTDARGTLVLSVSLLLLFFLHYTIWVHDRNDYNVFTYTQIRIVTTHGRPSSCKPLLDHGEFNELCVLYLYTFCVCVRLEEHMSFSVSHLNHPHPFQTVKSAWKHRQANCFLEFFFFIHF